MKQMIDTVKEMVLYTFTIAEKGLQNYLPRIAIGWWICSLTVIAVAIIINLQLFRGGHRKVSTAVGSVATVLYFVLVIVITFGSRLPDPHIQYQLVPFLSHKLALQGDENEQFQILCNVLLFVPFGITYPFLNFAKNGDSIVGLLKYAFIFTFGIEFLQLLTRIGCFEIDDMINNVLGAVIGYLLFSLCKGIYRVCLKMFSGKKMRY